MPSADAPGYSVDETPQDRIELRSDSHSNDSTLLPFLRSRESTLIIPAVAGYDTGCAHVETDAAESLEISAPESTHHYRSPRSVSEAMDRVVVRLPEGLSTRLETLPLHSETESESRSRGSVSSSQ